MLKKLVGPIIALAAICSVPAHAAEVQLDGQWQEFAVDGNFDPSLGFLTPDSNEPLSFLVSTQGPVALTIVDAGAAAGDRFELFDNGISLGLSSAVPNHFFDDPVGTDFDALLASGQFSWATFILSSGEHHITGTLAQSFADELGPLNITSGAVRLSAVPLPAAALLFLSGGGLFGLFARRRRNSTAV